jgi:hypothetical protein
MKGVLMKVYVGTKIIQAMPMMEHEFISDGGKKKVAASRSNREGYKVVYPNGYQSWSPKDVFEQAYREISNGEIDLILPPPECEKAA